MTAPERAALRDVRRVVVKIGSRLLAESPAGRPATIADQVAALLARGAHARLMAEPERVPAIVWTTVATGRGPAAHGILSPDTRRIAGLRTPVSLDAGGGAFTEALGRATDLLRLTRTQPAGAALRSVKTFWNVASEKGLRVGVVNWWATWPAEAVNGWLVSDRAAFKIEKGGPADREVSPAEAFETLRPLLDASDGDRARRLDRFHVAAARALRAAEPPLRRLRATSPSRAGSSPGSRFR